MSRYVSKKDYNAPPDVTVETVRVFRDWVRPGLMMQCIESVQGDNVISERMGKCVIRKKYPYFAMTNKGTQLWPVLAILNRDLLRQAVREH